LSNFDDNHIAKQQTSRGTFSLSSGALLARLNAPRLGALSWTARQPRQGSWTEARTVLAALWKIFIEYLLANTNQYWNNIAIFLNIGGKLDENLIG
jgi:hypothetical protein